MKAQIAHLCEVPSHATAVADLIHDAFWITVPGATPEGMRERIELAVRPDSMPLCLVAMNDGEPIGAVNLVDNDESSHRHWRPWVAGVVVAQPWRRRGVGTTLMQALLCEARRLRLRRMYFGTNAPAFYERLGAVRHERANDDFWYMRFDL
jgi:predicted N-acetyltransferase YhbS